MKRKRDGDGGPAVQARLGCLCGVATDGAGNVYIAAECIYKVDTAGTITIAVEYRSRGLDSVAADGAGNVYIADAGNSRIRKVDATGMITTFAGTGYMEWRTGGDGGSGPARLPPRRGDGRRGQCLHR